MIRIALIGAGGLGGPVALLLSPPQSSVAQIELAIFDPDRVELSNLHRQIQFSDADIGSNKAQVLAARVNATAYPVAWTSSAGDEFCSDCDLIVDTSDDPQTKFAVARWATTTGRPYVIASAVGVMGNVFVGAPGATCYQCVFEAPQQTAATCGDNGVLGPIVAMVADVAVAAAQALARGERGRAGWLWRCDDMATKSPVERWWHPVPRAHCEVCALSPMPPQHERILIAANHPRQGVH